MISRARFVFALHALASAATVFLFYATVGAQTLPTLPQATVDTTYNPPTGGTTWTVNSGGNLQTAINNAQPGDIIQLQAGATFTGNFVFPKKTGSGWIYIRSSAYSSLPAPGSRVSPSDASNMPRIQTTNTNPAIRIDIQGNQYRFVGIDIYANYSILSPQLYNTVLIGYDSNFRGPGDPSQSPDGIIFDRCYIHGNTSGSINAGILAIARNFAVVDSYISDIHSSYDESHGIQLYRVQTAKINNNYISASGINAFTGDNDDPGAAFQNTDITFTNNYFHKPTAWKGVWKVKNNFEIKYGERISVQNNIMENSWIDMQDGFCILFTPRGRVANHVTFKNNIIRGCDKGMSIVAADSDLHNVLIENNLYYNINHNWLYLGRANANTTVNMIVRHNTAIGAANGSAVWFDCCTPPVYNGWYVYNNIMSYKAYGVLGTGSNTGLPTVKYWTINYDWNVNVMIGGSPFATDANFRGFLYAANNAAVGFTNSALANPADFRLAVSSPYKGKATDGKDIGADIDAILNAASNPSPPAPPSPPMSPTNLVAQ